MSNYISISKNAINEIVDKSFNTSMKLHENINYLKSIVSLSKLTEEEEEILKKANEILIKKMEILEDVLEDENNQFYNIDNVDVE